MSARESIESSDGSGAFRRSRGLKPFKLTDAFSLGTHDVGGVMMLCADVTAGLLV